MNSYIKDGDEIYRRSFAIIRAEADLSGISADMDRVAVRIIHSCGMIDIVGDIAFSPGAGAVGRRALSEGAPILCDARMIAEGITRSRLEKGNQVICTLADPTVPAMAREMETTRTAAALELWRPHLCGAVVAIGNAPTALFRLLEMIDEGAPRPALIVGLPVGFVGAAESKQALKDDSRGVPFITVLGRRGGSAMATAAVNALATERE